MFYLKSILIAFVISAFTLYGFYNYVPVEGVRPLMTSNQDMLGASITTILGSDTLKASRSVINTNFDNLNSDKVEISTTTLPNIVSLPNLATSTKLAYIGTILSGIWNGTLIDVIYGGTGLATLPIGQVLLGSSTNAIATVNGFGTSGQFLTSNGNGLAPTWQTSAIALGDNYAWTGLHSWTATTTVATSTVTELAVASSTTAVGRITGTPTIGTDVTNKTYVDSLTTQYYVNYNERTNTSGEQIFVHGLTGTPDRIKITAVYIAAGSTGTWDGTSYATVYNSDSSVALTATLVAYLDAGGGNTMSATSTMDGTNIYIGWEEASSFPGSLFYLVEAWID